MDTAGRFPPPPDSVRREWARRIEAEYRSAALSQHFTLWLMQIGAPPHLLEAGLRIARDELVHTELSHEVYLAAGGTEPPRLDRTTLRLPHVPEAELELAVMRHGVGIFCLGETVAVRLFKRLRDRCTVPVARKALDRILVDETFHRDFGWEILGWLWSTPARSRLEATLAEEIGSMLDEVRADYVREGATAAGVDERASAWGLMGADLYKEAFAETVDRDYRPRFERLGITIDRSTP